MGAPSPELVDLWLAGAFNAQDIEAAAALYHPEARAVRLEQVHVAGTRRGRDQVGECFRKMAAVQKRLEYAPEHFIAQDDKVVVLGRFVMRVKATGKESRSEWAQVRTIMVRNDFRR